MNVKTRAEFDAFLADLAAAKQMVVDTETNGLKHYRENYIISIQCYFPDVDRSYYLAFRHGEGLVEIPYTAGNPKGTPYEEMNWSGNTKRALYLQYWFSKFADAQQEDSYFGNLPQDWLKEMKVNWAKPVHYYHNARFDLHMLTAEGFPLPEKVYDTMLALHVVYNDWNAADFEAPYTYTKTENKEKYGEWATDDNGKLLKKRQNGNRQLKWQAARIGLKDATVGEHELHAAKRAFEEKLVEFAMAHPDDPYNKGLKSYKTFRPKIKLDAKANMWMLPSDDVSVYGELDTRLTWGLWNWCYKILKDWDNLELLETFSQAQAVSFMMENNGFQLDVKQTKRLIKELKPQIDELHYLVTQNEWKLGNSKALLTFLNSGILQQDVQIDLPDWFPANRRANLAFYDEIELKSTESIELEKVEDHIIVRIILEYRKLKKTRDTYLVNWLKAATPEGIVRGSINVDGTSTGRSSSSGEAGNYQNIPERKGYSIKRAIVPYNAPQGAYIGDKPAPKWLFFAVDYGQLEGRLAAWIGEQELKKIGVHNLPTTMVNLFNGDFNPEEYPTVRYDRILKDGAVDLHKFTREILEVRNVLFGDKSEAEILMWFGYDPSKIEESKWADQIDDEIRQMSKTTNFGLLYSGTKYMLSKQLRIDLDAADELVIRWRKIFPAFAVAQEYFTELAQTRRANPTRTSTGMFVRQPISGRFLKYQLHSTNRYDRDNKRWFNLQEASTKKAWNGIVQGLGGWLTFDSLHRFGRDYGWEGVKPFAVIHDAIDGYYQEGYEWKIAKLMEYMIDYDVNPRLNTELKTGDTNWQDLKTVKDVTAWSKRG
jgi:DNA polymerase I-like protein with 3'-5' exonuclease and polymerase domains